jgi:WD40-like Beta Propeller Repeat
MKKLALYITFSFILLSINAQDSFKERFLEANTLMEESQINEALKIWLELNAEQPDNFNVNYKIGQCYIVSANDKKKALSYLIKAAQNTTGNYDPFSTSEKKSPIEAYFYLARAYHINYDLDKAMVNYNSFKEKISKKHYLFKEVDHHVEQCKYAKIAIANPVNITVENMGKTINSPAADYSPIMSIDESTMYFTSRRVRPDSSNVYLMDESDGQHFEDIFVSHNYDDQWTEPELLSINTEGHEATINISADGQTLFIYKDDDGDGNIYTSQLEGEDWSYPQKLGSDINLESKETHAHVSPDGNTLYFVSDRKNGTGGQDIYKCNRLPNGEWAKAQNLGDVINTPYDEDGVFIHPSGKTMYFSSKGHSSIGGYDIFYSTMDDGGNWGAPKNMGYPVNSTDNDVFFVTSADGKRGYYSSFKEEGYGEKDIYKISLEDPTAQPLTLLTGNMKVVGYKETPEDALIVVTDNETGEMVGKYIPRKRDGKFNIILTPGNDYHIVYSALDFKQEEDLYIPPISAYQEINRGIDLDDVVFGNPNNATNNTSSNNTNNNSTTSNNNTSNNSDEAKKLQKEIDKLKATIADLKNSNNNTSNNSDEAKKLQKEIDKLKATIADLKNSSNNTSSNNTANNDKKFQNEIDKLKAEIAKLKNSNNNSNYTPPTPAVIGDVLAYYQEFFNYNNKDINTSQSKYTDMINKAAKKSGKVVIDIESSASKVPTKTYGSNSSLAYKRAVDAQKVVIESLVAKGVKKENIIINDISSGVKGPQYNGDYSNTGVYEQYQYVIIKIR